MASQEINEQPSSSIANRIEDGNERLSVVSVHEYPDTLMSHNLEGQTQSREVGRVGAESSPNTNVEELSVVTSSDLSSGTSVHIRQAENTILSAGTVVQNPTVNQTVNQIHHHYHNHPPGSSETSSYETNYPRSSIRSSSSSSHHVQQQSSSEASSHETNYPRSSIRSSSSSRYVQQQTTPTEVDLEVLQDTIPKTPESASLSSTSLSHVYSSIQSSSSNPEATPQLMSQTPSSSQRTTSSLHSEQQESSTKEFEKLQKRTRKLYHPKHDVDVSNVDVSPENIPEIYPEMLHVDFYQGRFIPDDDNYNPKSRGIKLSGSDRTVTIDQLVSDIQKYSYVSVIGYPGSGKTTLSKRLARRLSQNDDCLVLRLLFMKMNKCNEQLELKEFLLGDCNYNLKDEEKNSVFECITDNPENCFIILDGFDQVSWNLEDNVKKSNYNTSLQYWELVSNLCLGIFLENCHLIFTSRPHAMLYIPKRCRPNRTYFIRDLTTDNMKTLFHALVNDQQQSETLWNELTIKTPHLTSMCHNPLMLQLYVKASLGSSQIDDISTMTRIFHTVLLNLKTSTHAVSTSDDIVIRLSKIAYEATKKGTVLITTDNLIKESLTSQKVQDLVVTLMGANREYPLLEGQQRLYFSHQTFQEYFSALYICREMSLPDFKLFVQNNLMEGHWSVVVLFTAGLLLDPIMNKDLSSSAMNQRPSVESTSALTQLPTSSSQTASNLSSTAMNQGPSDESTSSQTPSSSHQPSSSDEKIRKRQLFVEELLKETRKVASDHNDRSIIPITKILREGNDLKVTVTAGSHFDGGRIRMEYSNTQNDIHAVTSFIKSMPTRLGILALVDCFMTSNEFRPWKEAIKSMPGSIVGMSLDGNRLSVDDVIEVLRKFEEEVVMRESLDDGDEWRMRSPNMEERSKLQEALDRLDNKKLKIQVGGDGDSNYIYLRHKDC